jgi:Vibrio phage DNA polymerase
VAANNRRLWAVDCETDPAQYGRVPKPFLWGAYDGTTFLCFNTTEEFVAWARNQNAILYAHNGGKFDFIFLLLFIGQSKAQVINGRIVKMHLGKAELRDSYSIIPEKLAKFGKKEIDYAKLEQKVRHLHMQEITEYMQQDCVVLFDLVAEYRKVAGKKITIASNALAFSKNLGVDPGKTNHTYDKNLRPYFFGGRCQVFQPGTHANIRVIDIHSAYPFAMCHDHASGDQWQHIERKEFEKLPREKQQRAFLKISCFSDGAFPKRNATELLFPVGKDTYEITGWEYVTAVELGLIRNVVFHDCIVHDGTINFTPYVEHWYDYKARHDKKKFPIQYTIGKIMMNSLYGKLAQNPLRYYDYKIVPAGTNVCYEFIARRGERKICRACGEPDHNHGWEVYEEFDSVEIQRRPTLWKWEQKFGKSWEGRPLYNNVATGASITGFTRAHLLRAIHAVGIQNVFYCDTDSIICRADASLEKLSLSEKLGDWADEGTATIGHFAGKKIYGLRMSDGKEKIASKGSKLDFQQIEALMRGEIVQWRSDFPSFSVAGNAAFVVRNIRQTAKAIPPTLLH